MPNYIKLTWTNTCDLGRILYNGTGFTNVFFFDGDIIKPDYQYEEVGFESGEAVFLKTSETLKKRCKFEVVVPEYVADALEAMPLHDDIRIMFVDGRYSTAIRNVQTDVNWDDEFNGCMAQVVVSFEQDDQIVKTACCDNMV